MILTINKNGEITQRNIKNYDNLYSICNYRNDNNFELLHVWNNEYYLYGKNAGRSGYENNYKMPSPVNNQLYYGTLCIIKKKENMYLPLTLEEWTSFYNKLMNIDLTENNIDNDTTTEESESEEENIFNTADDVLTYEEYELEY
jgi:hypothetical protein